MKQRRSLLETGVEGHTVTRDNLTSLEKVINDANRVLEHEKSQNSVVTSKVQS